MAPNGHYQHDIESLLTLRDVRPIHSFHGWRENRHSVSLQVFITDILTLTGTKYSVVTGCPSVACTCWSSIDIQFFGAIDGWGSTNPSLFDGPPSEKRRFEVGSLGGRERMVLLLTKRSVAFEYWNWERKMTRTCQLCCRCPVGALGGPYSP